MNKVYIVRYYDTIQHAFATREKAEEYVSLMRDKDNICYDLDYTIEEYDLVDDIVSDMYYDIAVYMEVTRDAIMTDYQTFVIKTSGADVLEKDIGICFTISEHMSPPYNYILTFKINCKKKEHESDDEIKQRCVKSALDAFTVWSSLIRNKKMDKQEAAKVVEEKLKEEMI